MLELWRENMKGKEFNGPSENQVVIVAEDCEAKLLKTWLLMSRGIVKEDYFVIILG